MNIDHKTTIEEFAEQSVANWRKFHSFGWSTDEENPSEFAIYYTHNRDSGLLELSNAQVIEEELSKFIEFDSDSPDVGFERHNQFLCGWIKGFRIRVYQEGTKTPTPAFVKWFELCKKISNYPVLDEEDFSQRESDSQMEAIKSAFDSVKNDFIGADKEGIVEDIWRFLWDNHQHAIECGDDGVYIDPDDMRGYLEEMGFPYSEEYLEWNYFAFAENDSAFLEDPAIAEQSEC